MNTREEPMRSLTDDDLRTKVLGAVSSEPSMTRAQSQRRNSWLVVLCSAAVLAIFEAWGGPHVQARPPLLVAASSIGTAALAALALLVVLRRDRSMLGRPRLLLAAITILVPMAFLGWKAAVSNLYVGMTAPWPDRPGFRCLALGLALGTLPLVLTVLLRKRSDPVHPTSTGMAIGAGWGVAAATLVDLWCPVAHIPHLLLGHFLPVTLLALAGALAGLQFLPPRFKAWHGKRCGAA
jgi:hypothetical protein